MHNHFFPAVLIAASLAGCGIQLDEAHARPTALRAASSPTVAGDWVMTIRIGERTFEDRFTLTKGPAGGFTGTLTVVGQWSAPLERIEAAPGRLAFELLAPEGAKPFRVRYDGALDAAHRTWKGTATLPETGEALGAFEAVRSAARSFGPTKGA